MYHNRNHSAAKILDEHLPAVGQCGLNEKLLEQRDSLSLCLLKLLFTCTRAAGACNSGTFFSSCFASSTQQLRDSAMHHRHLREVLQLTLHRSPALHLRSEIIFQRALQGLARLVQASCRSCSWSSFICIIYSCRVRSIANDLKSLP